MTSEVKILCVAPDLVDDMASAAHEMLARGLATAPEATFAEHLQRVRDGKALLWVALRSDRLLAAFLTEIVQGDGAKWVGVYGMAGVQVHAWRNAIRDRLVAFAAEEGCDCIRFAGRAAWGRIFRDCSVIGAADGQAIFERAA